MFRTTAFAALIALGGAAAAQAADQGPQLVNRNGNQEVVYDDGTLIPTGNIVGGAHATITGGGDNTLYRAAPGGRTEEPALVGRLVNRNGNQDVVYDNGTTAPRG